MHLLSLPLPPPADTTPILIPAILQFDPPIGLSRPFSFEQFRRIADNPINPVRVTWSSCHVPLEPGSFSFPSPFSRDALRSISCLKLTTSFSVLGYNSPERQVCQRPSYSVHDCSVEGHYRLLSGCNRPSFQLEARACRKAFRMILEFVCTVERPEAGPLGSALGESG